MRSSPAGPSLSGARGAPDLWTRLHEVAANAGFSSRYDSGRGPRSPRGDMAFSRRSVRNGQVSNGGSSSATTGDESGAALDPRLTARPRWNGSRVPTRRARIATRRRSSASSRSCTSRTSRRCTAFVEQLREAARRRRHRPLGRSHRGRGRRPDPAAAARARAQGRAPRRQRLSVRERRQRRPHLAQPLAVAARRARRPRPGRRHLERDPVVRRPASEWANATRKRAGPPCASSSSCSPGWRSSCCSATTCARRGTRRGSRRAR